MSIIVLGYSRDGADRFYVSRKEGGIGLAGIQDSVDVSTQRLEDNKKTRRKTDNND